MKWYWGVLIVIVVLTIIVGVWYYMAANKNLEQLRLGYIGFTDINTKQGIIDYTLNGCNNSDSKTVASLVSLAGVGKYKSQDKGNYNNDELNKFTAQICNCINTKSFSIIDLYYNSDNKYIYTILECKAGD